MQTTGYVTFPANQNLPIQQTHNRTDVNFTKWLDEVLEYNARLEESLTQNDWMFLKNRYKEKKPSNAVNL